jgi:GNAT superfamily N-acetyltransferase
VITLTEDLSGLTADDLDPFFVGWPDPPSLERRLEVLRAATHTVLALDEGRTVGFLTVISDRTFAAYLPLLEVVPTHQGQGIGTRLVQRALELTRNLYMVDVVCDPDVAGFYTRLGLRPLSAMAQRNVDALRNP